MNSSPTKKKALTDIANADDIKRWSKYDVTHWLPIKPLDTVPELPELPHNNLMSKMCIQCYHYTITKRKQIICLTVS